MRGFALMCELWRQMEAREARSPRPMILGDPGDESSAPVSAISSKTAQSQQFAVWHQSDRALS